MQLAPEFQLFCLALREPRPQRDTENLWPARLDWSAIVSGARRHRLAPLVLSGLKHLRNVPAGVVAELRRETLASAKGSLAQVAELGRLMHMFSQAHVRVLALKGVALSAQLYGDACARAARDIDLLADPLQLARVDAMLAGAGYRCSIEALSPRQRASYRYWIKDVEYFHAATGAVLELHDRLADNPRLLHFDFETLWREREEVRVGNVLVPTMSRRALALYLCVHGASHAWERLRWLVDLAAVLHKPGSVDSAVADAETANLGPAILHALMRAHDWLGLAIEDCHLARARASARVLRLDGILGHLYAGSAWHEMPPRRSWQAIARYSLWQRLYRLLLKSDWRYRASQSLREGFSAADFVTVRLPDRLFFLYPLVRPFGWFVRRLAARKRS